MKTSVGLLGTVFALSLAAWAFFYYLAEGEPLTPPETLVVVAGCAAIVFAARFLWGRVRKPPGDADEP
jgi:hypothetical protein